jgi:hypothetical protein
MRLSLLLAIVLVFGLSAGLSAQIVKFEIPFAFVGFDADCPAGEYGLSVVSLNRMIRLSAGDLKSGQAQFIQTLPGKEVKLDGKAYLVFQKIGSVHVLREYRDGAHSAAMRTPLSKERQSWEKSYIAKHVRGEYVLIAAR